ncbi:MAG: hypothetical protein IMF11_05975 [Proteobacteria bacterium]|nr:hypothetical protein [Pseudomonadota bacterium]
MMARKWRMEQLSVVADPWILKLKPAKLKGVPFLSEVHSELALVSFS